MLQNRLHGLLWKIFQDRIIEKIDQALSDGSIFDIWVQSLGCYWGIVYGYKRRHGSPKGLVVDEAEQEILRVAHDYVNRPALLRDVLQGMGYRTRKGALFTRDEACNVLKCVEAEQNFIVELTVEIRDEFKNFEK